MLTVKFGIGQAVRRVEDQRFTTGAGEYVADLVLPRQCYGIQVLSPHAHAKINKVDVTAAKNAPGVVCMLTGADAIADNIGGIPPHFMPEHWGGPKGFGTIRPVLLADYVRCVGDRIAFVVAETEQQARDAAELVAVDYDPLPVLVDAEQAAKPEAPVIWNDCPNGNVAVTIALGDKAATDAAFAAAKYRRFGSSREQQSRSERSRAALCARHIRPRTGQIHSPHGVARPPWRQDGAVLRRLSRSRIKGARSFARCRRRIWRRKPISIPKTYWCCGPPNVAGVRSSGRRPAAKV